MSPLRICEYVDKRGAPALSAWLDQLADKKLKAKLKVRLEMFRLASTPNTEITFPVRGVKGFFEIRLKGRVQWRPMGFYGPQQGEFTFVAVFGERDNKFPASMPGILETRRREVNADNSRRRPYDPE